MSEKAELTSEEKALCAEVAKEWLRKGALVFPIRNHDWLAAIVMLPLGCGLSYLGARALFSGNVIGAVIVGGIGLAMVYGGWESLGHFYSGNQLELNQHSIVETKVNAMGKKEQQSVRWDAASAREIIDTGAKTGQTLTIDDRQGRAVILVTSGVVQDYKRLRAALIAKVGIKTSTNQWVEHKEYW